MEAGIGAAALPTTVMVTTVGATFSPWVTASTTSITLFWSSPGFSTVTGTAPTLSFGSAGTRAVYMTAIDSNGYDAMSQVQMFNIGFLNTDDEGQSSLPSSYNWTSQEVSAVANVNSMTGLQVFCAANIATLGGTLDCSGMGQLQHIECYASQFQNVYVSGCISMIRLCVEENNLTVLNINPVQPNLLDLRAAGQAGDALTLVPLAIDALSEWHFCIRDQVITNWPDLGTQFPVLEELWIWNTGYSGELAPGSILLTNVQAYDNSGLTSAVFADGAFSDNDTYLDLHDCTLASITLPTTNGLIYVDLSGNALDTAQVNSVLENLAGNSIADGIVNLSGGTNGVPSGGGSTAVTTLEGRGWTVTVNSGGGGNFTHEDSAFNSSTSATSLSITLSGAVSAGDLLVMVVQTAGGSTNVTVTDTASNVWASSDGGQTWYCLSSLAAPSGLTVTAVVTGDYYIHQVLADRFAHNGTVTYGAGVSTGSSGTPGLNYNNTGCGDLGTVAAGVLAWGAFSSDDTTGNQEYTAGFQSGSSGTADVIGSQFAGAAGTGVSMYVLDCVNADVTLTWYGTGGAAFGHAVSAYFPTS
jgi:hypothetical protein